MEVDRYKARSLKAYDGPLADRYDTSLPVRLLDLTVMDDFVLDALGDSLADLAILDVGCGTGRLLARLAAVGVGTLAGSDLGSRMVELTRRRLSSFDVDVELRCADAETALPWPSAAFDAVVSTGVLHHFYQPGAALAEMGRVLRQDGRLIVADPCFFTPLRETFNALLRFHPRDGDFYFYTADQATRLLSAHGWLVERCERLNWWAFGATARHDSLTAALAN
jgi:SAM-dependent methyltransferase